MHSTKSKISILFMLMVSAMLIFCGGCQINNTAGINPKIQVVYNKDILKINMSRIETLDPAYVSTAEEIYLCRLIFSGLVKNTNEGIVGDLALSWEISSNGLVYTFYLNPDVKFHNGHSLTADDIKFSWERALRTGAPNGHLFMNIAGAQEVLNGTTRALSGVNADDPLILQIRLQKPQANFLSSLTATGAFALQRTQLVEHGINYARPSGLFSFYPLPAGTGPLVLSEWLDGTGIALTAYEGYYGDKFPCRRCEITLDISPADAVMNMDINKMDIIYHIMPEEMPLTKKYAELQIVAAPLRTFSYLTINPSWIYTDKSGKQPVDTYPLADEHTRMAIMEAISSIDIISLLAGVKGIATDNMVEYWYGAEATTSPQYKKPVTNSGTEPFTVGAGFPVLPVFCGSDPNHTIIAGAIAAKMMQIGITTEIIQVSNSELTHATIRGTAAICINSFSDCGGGIDLFFSMMIDDRRQQTIPAGVWSETLYNSYNGSETTRIDSFAAVEKRLAEAAVFKCLYFEESALAYTQKKDLLNILQEILPLR